MKLDPATGPTLPKRDYAIPDMSDRGEKVRVSYSELATFRDCPLKWQLRYFWRLQPPEKSINLDRGSCWHAMMEAHYLAIREGIAAGLTGKDLAEFVRVKVLAALNGYAARNVAIDSTEFETLMWMYDDYARIYGADREYHVLAAESEFTFPFPVPGAPGLVIVGKIDLETETGDGRRQVWDHKSAKGRDLAKEGFRNEMLLEDQFVLYGAAKREAGEPVSHVIYNAARTDRLKRKMLDTERYVRVRMPYSDAAYDDAWNDSHRAAAALVRMWDDPDLVYSVPNPRQCAWKCDFQRAHIESRISGRDILEVAVDYGFTFKDRSAPPPEPVAEGDGGW